MSGEYVLGQVLSDDDDDDLDDSDYCNESI